MPNSATTIVECLHNKVEISQVCTYLKILFFSCPPTMYVQQDLKHGSLRNIVTNKFGKKKLSENNGPLSQVIHK